MNPLLDTALLNRLNGGSQAAETAPGRTRELGQEQFFELMIAQLRNQDPTRPLDGAEYLGQLAQFSAVSGIQGLQQSFNQIGRSLQSLHALQASSLVGRSVVVAADQGFLPADGPLAGRVELADAASGLTVDIVDASGQVLRRLPLGERAAGDGAFAWDGYDQNGNRLPPGVYGLRAEGILRGRPTALATQVLAAVQSVTLDPAAQGMTLNLAGLGPLDIDDVREIV
ncbi:MAG: flagellar hook assembly protein FlgD [Pseudomonadota bacterium]|nr:flagellar hook assembly protein FlgD [Pseudomonadota bacterium]